MRRSLAILAASLAAALAVVPGHAGRGNQSTQAQATRQCGDAQHTVTYDGPLSLWPPNHKFANASVTAADAAHPGGAVSLSLTPSIVDIAGGDGGAQHDPDVTFNPPSGTNSGTGSTAVEVALRAERSGKGEGRTYTMNWAASFDGGDTMCASSPASDADPNNDPFVVTVPHDKGKRPNEA